MKRMAAFVLAALALSPVAIGATHRIPKDRAALTNGDWFPYVISKLAPLEWWSFASTADDLRRPDYPSDWTYDLAKQNTWEFPRFCFSMFRPAPEAFASLLRSVESYSGGVSWHFHDYCIGAFLPGPTRYGVITQGTVAQLEEAARNPPQADPEFVKRALADIPKFCAYLEVQLGLKDKSPLDFDPGWLTREGLASSRGPFEDFIEPGSWTVFLASDPAKFAKTFQSTSPLDRPMNMGIGIFESDALFKDLGADWDKYQSAGEVGPILPDYPLLSRLYDIVNDAIYQPDEVDGLLTEYLRAQAVVNDSRAIRGLDNLIRVARWAQKLRLGIYFGGQ